MIDVLGLLFFFIDAATTEIYPLSLHDALPILAQLMRHPPETYGLRPDGGAPARVEETRHFTARQAMRSEEHTSELQSRENLVCRLLLEKKKRSRAAP